ncbi:tRNA pseudouridine(55) synthase TruB [Thiobacter aerophilum]|uniref:tRNA pseudouridine synthase B n=1 Tax=Thiobacter aerophilum TaxID=3121275 RepID=A0ABV0EKH8_9BURK
MKRDKRPVDGVLLLDKPVGVSSNGALQHVKRLYRAAKAGHTGNLDPIASGLLPICFGEATKFSQYLTDADKRYRAQIRLGQTTDTGDAEGRLLATHPVRVNLQALQAVLRQFVGEIEQVPPMHSALKHQGRPLYHYARKGVEVERMPRRITIFELTLLGFDGHSLFEVDVHCSKGTYIRVLAEDIGRVLGCGAHMAALRRTGVDGFTIERSIALDRLDAMSDAERDRQLLPADVLVAHLPRIDLDADGAFYFRRGQGLWMPRLQVSQEYRIYDEKQQFIGVGRGDRDGRLAPRRLVAQRHECRLEFAGKTL